MFQDWLITRAEQLGHTQADIHRLLEKGGHEVHVTTVNKWFLGKRTPTRRHLQALMHVLGINDPVERARIRDLAAELEDDAA